MLELLVKNRAFRRLAIAQWVSFCGDWFNLIAIVMLLGPEHRESALTIAFALVLKQLPIVALTPIAGVCADKFDRKRIMIATDIARAFLVLLLIFLHPTQGTVLVIVTLLAVASAFFDPARTASIPQLVEIGDLRMANAIAATFFPIGLLFGSVLGGLVTEYGGVNMSLFIDAISFLVSAYFLSELPALSPFEAFGPGPRGEITYREFFRSKIPTPDHRMSMMIKGMFGLGGAAYLVQLTISSQLQLGETGAVGLSAMLFARALGGLCGGVFGPRLFREGDEIRAIRVGFLSVAVSYLIIAGTDRLWLFLPAIFIGHMGTSFTWMFSSLWMQRLFANEERGRAFGADFALNMLTASGSTLLAGLLLSKGVITNADVAMACGIIWGVTGLLLLRFKPGAVSDVRVPVQVLAGESAPI